MKASLSYREMNNKFIRIIPGVLICLLIAVPSWIIGRMIPIVGPAIISIAIGIAIASIFPGLIDNQKIHFADGIKTTSKKLLQFSIILLGFEMNFFNIIRVGGQSLLIMIFTLATAFIAAIIFGKLLKLSGDTTTLIGVGTAICGGSAIAATAPVIRAKDEDVARAISTIFLFNIIAVFIFPLLGHLLGMNDEQFGLWAGTAINDTSSVVASSTSWSIAEGNNNALQMATIVKLTRTLMIVPVTLFLAFYTSRKQKIVGESGYKLAKIFPWFVLFFVLAAVINTVFSLPSELSGSLASIGKFVIVMAMAAIGLNTNIKSLFAKGYKSLLLGLFCWFSLATVSVIIVKVFC